MEMETQASGDPGTGLMSCSPPGGNCSQPAVILPPQGDGAGGEELESCSDCSCEACCSPLAVVAAAKDPNLELNFTNVRAVSREALLQQDRPAVFPSLTLPQPAKDLTVALEDLHAWQARQKSKKPRHCSFCKIHGFSVNIKGHKPFCQFREKCLCKGCLLMRCNQQVSKNQVRLRRQKDMEVDLVQMVNSPEPADQSLDEPDSLKTGPMCFKCWIHDSVRVRLKGHRVVCPYSRCGCSNCSLNKDRKRLTRELRQLAEDARDRKGGEGVTSGVTSGVTGCSTVGDSTGIEQQLLSLQNSRVMASMGPTSSSDQQQDGMNASFVTTNATAAGAAATVPVGQYLGNIHAGGGGMGGVVPVKMHRAGDWHLNTLLSSLSPPHGHRQETTHLPSILSGLPCGQVSSLPFNTQLFPATLEGNNQMVNNSGNTTSTINNATLSKWLTDTGLPLHSSSPCASSASASSPTVQSLSAHHFGAAPCGSLTHTVTNSGGEFTYGLNLMNPACAALQGNNVCTMQGSNLCVQGNNVCGFLPAQHRGCKSGGGQVPPPAQQVMQGNCGHAGCIAVHPSAFYSPCPLSTPQLCQQQVPPSQLELKGFSNSFM